MASEKREGDVACGAANNENMEDLWIQNSCRSGEEEIGRGDRREGLLKTRTAQIKDNEGGVFRSFICYFSVSPQSNRPPSYHSVLHTVTSKELLRGNRIFWSFLAVAVVYFSPSVMPFITSLSELSRLGALQLIEMTFPDTHTHCPHRNEL